jgi:hypothetical protein
MTPISIAEDQIPLLHGANGKFTANVDVVSPASPLPVSATAIADVSFSGDGKTSIGNDISLRVSASTSVKLATLFKEQTGAAPDVVKALGLDKALTDNNMIVALDLGGKADLSASGSYKYNVLSATASLEAGADARLINTRVYDDRKEAAGDVLADFVSHLCTPGAVVEPPRSGQVVYLEFGGYLNLGATLAAGYSMKGTHDFQQISSLKLSESYSLSVTGKFSLAAKLAGRFSITVQSADDLHPGDPHWARVTVSRQRTQDLQISAGVSASAEIDTQGLPATGKEFLGSLLGLRAKNWINQADSILSQAAAIHTPADLTKMLDGLAQTYLSRFVNKAVDQLAPAELQNLLGKLKNVVDSYNNLEDNAVTLFDRYFGTIETDLKPALTAIEGLGSLNEFKGEIDPVLWNVVQQLTGGNILDTILKQATGLQTLQDAAAKALSLVEDDAHKDIRDFIALSKQEFDLDNIVNELAKFDSLDKLKAQASDAANHVVERILGKAVAAIDKNDFNNLVKFVQAVEKGEQGFFGKLDQLLKEAAGQKFTADINLAYESSSETDALIDVDIRLQNSDGTDNADGLSFMRSAGLADFTAILQRYDPGVVQLRQGKLTHKMSTSNGIKVNITGWHSNFQYQSSYLAVVNTERQIKPASNGMLHVFTTVDLSASHDITRKTSKAEQQMHSNFALRFIAENTMKAMTPDDRAYVLDVITASTASYSQKLVDSNTTPEKLNRILAFAAELGLDKKGATMDALKPILKLNGNSFGAIQADYEVRFSEVGLSRLFAAPGPLDLAAVHTILRQIVMSAYLGDAGLEPVAWQFCCDKIRDLALGNPNFVNADSVIDSAGNIHVEVPFPGLVPNLSLHDSTVRALVAMLFRVEASLIDGLTQIHNAVQVGHFTLDALEKASKTLANSLDAFDSEARLGDQTAHPVFAVFERLIQLATPAIEARSSALTLTLGPTTQPAEQKTMLFQLVAVPAPQAVPAGR